MSSFENIPESAEVVIVGAGVAGAGAAYHLVSSGVKNIVVLEAGSIGNGCHDTPKSPDHARNDLDMDQEVEYRHAHRSGTAVLPETSTIKMMVQLYASSSADFITHHGREGAQRYLQLTKKGLDIQKALAQKVLPDVAKQYRSTGSLYLAYKKDHDDFRSEFETLRSLGEERVEWYEREQLQHVPGCPPAFHCGIYFPDDAIINSPEFAKGLLREAVHSGAVRVFEDCRVVDVASSGGDTTACVTLVNGQTIKAQHVVVATGGLHQFKELSGIIRPCWSYLSGVPPHPEYIQKGSVQPALNPLLNPASRATSGEDASLSPHNSMNFFTWGFTHDWSWVEGAVRVSGEDHFSAFKPPRTATRCANMGQWVSDMYPGVFTAPGAAVGEAAPLTAMATQCGVYSETPDSVPVVGSTGPRSPVCYLLGCNAWGQTVLSYASSLVPGLLGYKDLDTEQKKALSLFTVRRFQLLPGVQEA